MPGATSETVAVMLAGGRGERAKPITLESADYIRSKAVIPFLGRRLVEWVVELCKDQGIRRFYVIAQGLENRSQIKLLLGHGQRHGVEISYSRAGFDPYNVGSGSAFLHNLEQWKLTGRALVLPVDSVLDFSLEELERTHQESAATVTVATVGRTRREVAGKYGVLRTDPAGRVRGFAEKPSAQQLRTLFPGRVDEPLPTSAGMYLVDCDRLRRAARDPQLMRLAQQRLDWGGDLLPWLVEHDEPVAAHRIARLGDLGNVPDYLAALRDVLSGAYRRLNRLMGPPTAGAADCWIDETSLRTRDPVSGTTLTEKIADGRVKIGPGVHIGRHVEVGDDVSLEYADIGDGVELGEGARLSGVAVGDYSLVGPYAELSDSYIGPMAVIRSERGRPVRLESHTAIGDGVSLRPGSRLSGVSVYPRLRIPAHFHVPSGTWLTCSDDVLQWV
ncbi:sugar phosphate nucleotidyltransferase [Streptomyces sp. NBC_00203]|uniref:sugar phosphate nucleotidyltransferase n=1 Tax=Streptomyces sp. NBC_00203 TaxID=2975680 RepID=UPI00324D8462